MKTDKLENSFWNKKKFKTVNKILEEEFKDRKNQVGICHQIWARKKQLLKDLYNLDWKSPAELNPDIIFD